MGAICDLWALEMQLISTDICEFEDPAWKKESKISWLIIFYIDRSMTNKFFISAAWEQQIHLFHLSSQTKEPLWIVVSVWVGIWGGERVKLGECWEKREEGVEFQRWQIGSLHNASLSWSISALVAVTPVQLIRWKVSEKPLIPCQTKVCKNWKSITLHLG